MNLSKLTPAQLEKIKVVLFALCLLPLVRLFYGALNQGLGANPIEFMQRFLGTWTFNFLLITLMVTPLRKLTGWHWLIRLRRMLGLFAFFYATMHLLNWLVLDNFFDWRAIVADILKRPYITVGFCRLRAPGPAGRHLQQCHGAPSRRPALAEPAPQRLCRCHSRCGALLVAGEEGCDVARDLRRDGGAAIGCARPVA